MNRAWSRRTFLTTTCTGAATILVRSAQSPPIAFAIHGGAGVIDKQSMPAEREAQYRLKLTEAGRVAMGYAETIFAGTGRSPVRRG